MKPLYFAIIGCGMIAQWHADALKALGNAVSLTGVADVNPIFSQAFAEKNSVKFYPSIDALLSDNDVDAVCICTPNGSHASLALKALEHGKHVLIEKPLALTVEDCDRIMETAEKTGLCVGVVSQRRFAKTIQAVHDVIRDGHIGTVVSAELNIRYYRDEDYYQKSTWHGSRSLDGGVLMNQGVHGMDILLYLMGDAAVVCGFCANRLHDIEAEDTVSAAIHFQNGALGTVLATTASAPGSPQILTVSGTKGSITLTENEITGWDVPGVPKPEVRGLSAGGFGGAGNIAIDGHLAQLRDFADAAANHRKPFVTPKDGRKVVQLICAVYRSAEENRYISL